MDKTSIVLFGRTPPPVQGESVMIERSLRALREGFKVFHVNAVLSPTHAAISRFELIKIAKIVGYVAQALWYRIRFDARVFYYFPAPPKRIAFYRDLAILGLCRPFFSSIVLHWQSSGLGRWVAEEANPFEQTLVAACFHGHALSIVTTEFDQADADRLLPRRVEVVPNSVEDPCVDFETALLPERERRRGERERALSCGESAGFRVLFLSLCLASKGLFCTLDAVRSLADRLAAEGNTLSVRLDVCGEFYDLEERRRFDAFCVALPSDGSLTVEYHGFVEGGVKDAFFRDADAFCLPTRYPGEAFPVALVEAMAYGLPVITTRWKGIPSVLPADYFGLCNGQAPEEAAATLQKAILWSGFKSLRDHYLDQFEFTRFAKKLRESVARGLGFR